MEESIWANTGTIQMTKGTNLPQRMHLKLSYGLPEAVLPIAVTFLV
jgi:hypothetical protein